MNEVDKEKYFYKDTKNFVEEVTNRTEQINERTKTIYRRFCDGLIDNGTKVRLDQNQLHDIYEDCAAIAELSSIMHTYEHDYLHDYQRFMAEVGTKQEAVQADKVHTDIQKIHHEASNMPSTHNVQKANVHHEPAPDATHSHKLGKQYFKKYTVQKTGSFGSRIARMFKRFSFSCHNFAKDFFD